MAEKTDEVSGEFTYYGNPDESPSQCLAKAEEGAIVDALQKKYGTTVTQSIVTTERTQNNRGGSDFMMLSQSEVNGQWLGHSAPADKHTEMDSNGCIIATVKVKGKACRLNANTLLYDVVAMRNGTDRNKDKSSYFSDGDLLYLYFTAPTDGYLSIFLLDEEGNVFCLFPYPGAPGGQAKMRANYEYVLFDENRGGSTFGDPTPLMMTAQYNLEYNKLYTIFSVEPFSLPPMQGGVNVIPHLDQKDFTKWLARLRASQQRVGVQTMNLSIEPAR